MQTLGRVVSPYLDRCTPPPMSRATAPPAPLDDVQPSSSHWYRGLMLAAAAATTLVPSAYSQMPPAPPLMATTQPAADPAPQAAVALPRTSDVLDSGLTFDRPTRWRMFGHQVHGGQTFDTSGNWSDTQTAVSADQFAAMPDQERIAFARRAHLSPDRVTVGDASRVTLQPAIGKTGPDDIIDEHKTLLNQSGESERNFGHERVHGKFFGGRYWADTHSLVSADQVAAMSDTQRLELATVNHVEPGQLRLGNAAHVLRQEASDTEATGFEGLRPSQFVVAHGFPMTAATAVHYEKLLRMVRKRFPGREVEITATTNGMHLEAAHHQGKAVDFVVEHMTRKESMVLEDLCWKAGFRPFNEYVHSSRYKTGDHMHVSLEN